MNKRFPHIASSLRMSAQERILLFKRLGMMLRSGLPLLDALCMMRAEARSRHGGVLLLDAIIGDVSAGRSLSAALSRHERHIGAFCVQAVRIGESSGTLRENLEYLADELKRTRDLKRRVAGALIYPGVIVAATLGIVGLLVTYIFPKILPVLSGVQGTLPFSTRTVIAASHFVSEYGLLALATLVGLGAAFLYVRRFERVRLATDGLLVRLPVFGPLVLSYNIATLSRTLALLLHSDGTIVSALELAAASTRNAAYRAALSAARDTHAHGHKLSVQFAAHPHLFSSVFTQMISVGESAGSLADSFLYLSDIYEEEVNERTRTMTTLLEPMLMVVMGLTVGFIAISIITPIYSITQSLGSYR